MHIISFLFIILYITIRYIHAKIYFICIYYTSNAGKYVNRNSVTVYSTYILESNGVFAITFINCYFRIVI
jgi:hypothetical protein